MLKSRREVWFYSVLVIGVGFALRWLASSIVAPPSGMLYSDMLNHAVWGEKIFNGQSLSLHEHYSIPQGLTIIHVAIRLLGLDPMVVLPKFNIVLDLLYCLVIARLATLLISEKAGFVALVISCLFPPFILQSGFPLSEPAFAFLGLSAYYWYVKACSMGGPQWAFGLFAGLSLFMAILFKTSLLMLLIFVILASLAFPWMRVRRTFLVGFAVAGLLVTNLGSVTQPDSRNTEFANVIANPAINLFHGRTNTVRLIAIDPQTSQWVFNAPPALNYANQKGADTLVVSHSILDGWYFLERTAEFVIEYPLTLITYSADHVFDLFGRAPYWPLVESRFSWLDPSIRILVLVFIVFPAVLALFAPVNRGSKIFLILPVVSIIVVAAVFFGSPRYRLPFDGYFIVLATIAYLWMSGNLTDGAKDPHFVGESIPSRKA